MKVNFKFLKYKLKIYFCFWVSFNTIKIKIFVNKINIENNIIKNYLSIKK
jgi:hypothetical protein